MLHFVQVRYTQEETRSMHISLIQQRQIPGFTYIGGVRYILLVKMKTETSFEARQVKQLQQIPLTYYRTIRMLILEQL
jgi:hypothetical protein